jgi:Protein of unknown function (DUF3631)/Toprim domain
VTVWTAEHDERLRTWAIPVAETLLGESPRIQGGEAKFGNGTGLSITQTTGRWYSFTAHRGGWSTLGLIDFLRPAPRAERIAWATAFLSAHPGTGPATGAEGDDDGEAAEAASRAAAEAAMPRMVPPEGTPAATYLASRDLPGPWPEIVRFLPSARTGEGAVVGLLTAHDRTVGLQFGYLTPNGAKSLALPQRRRLALEKAKGAVFTIPPRDANATPLSDGGLLVITEGLENALSINLACPTATVWGLPGIWVLGHLDVAALKALLADRGKCVVFRDGKDAAGSSAARSCSDGLDHLLLGELAAVATSTPAGQDANSLLQAGGVGAVTSVIEGALLVALTLQGAVKRLARLPLPDYDRERKPTAKQYGLRLATLDDLVATERPKKSKDDDAAIEIPADPPWDGPIHLCETLDAALVEVSRYIVAPLSKLVVIVLWPSHTHLFGNTRVNLQRSPRLAVQSRGPGCGKTTALEIVSALSFRGTVRSSATASTILRTLGAVKRTYCLDEADRQLSKENGDLIAILDAGDRKSTALVERSVPMADGGWRVQSFDVWGPVAFAGIDELPDTLQDRSVRVFLQRATGDEVPEHLRDGTSDALVAIRRQLTAWADSLFELPEPALPDVLLRQAGRVGDRWRPLIAIADLAGGRWPDLARKAALEEIVAEKQPSLTERLLSGIRRAFNMQQTGGQDDADNSDRLTTPTLLRVLLEDTEEDWNTAARGKPISAYFLRDRLRGLLNPPEEGKPHGATDWWTGPEDKRQHHRGYYRLQFGEAFRRYLPAENLPSARPAKPSGASGRSGGPGAGRRKSAENRRSYAPDPAPDGDGAAESTASTSPIAPDAAPDAAAKSPDHENDPVRQKRRKSATKSAPAQNAPDAPHVGAGRENESLKPNGENSTYGSTSGVSSETLIRTAAKAYPGKTVAQLAKLIGQPESRVRQVRGDDAP